ncbi:MAG: NHL repeat-containing protein [candidate division Zixibacteria bacterium]|nr:NHL repeat-containing protein [candidate division Zixibacteria bacterium]
MRAALKQFLCWSLLVIVSCGGRSGVRLSEEVPARVPAYLVVKAEISGYVLKNRLKRPVGLAAYRNGRVVVADAGNHRLVRFKADMTADIEKGGFGTQAGLLNNPSFLVLDNELNLFVTDEGNDRVARFNSQLNFVDEIEFYDVDDLALFGTASGVALAGYGECWIADREKNQIAIFDNVGRFDRMIGDFGYSGGQLRSPEKIVTDINGDFLVCDAGNSRLVVYDGYGNFDREIKNDAFEYPISLAIDHDRLWILDAARGVVFLCDRRGRVLFEAGPNLLGSERPLKRPSDLVLLPDKRLLISDSGNDRLVECRIGYEGD